MPLFSTDCKQWPPSTSGWPTSLFSTDCKQRSGGLRPSCGGLAPPASRAPAALYPVEEDAEDDARAEDGAAPQLMPEDDAADGQTQHLPRRHHDREDDRPELFNGVEDEELARGRRYGYRHVI